MLTGVGGAGATFPDDFRFILLSPAPRLHLDTRHLPPNSGSQLMNQIFSASHASVVTSQPVFDMSNKPCRRARKTQQNLKILKSRANKLIPKQRFHVPPSGYVQFRDRKRSFSHAARPGLLNKVIGEARVGRRLNPGLAYHPEPRCTGKGGGDEN